MSSLSISDAFWEPCISHHSQLYCQYSNIYIFSITIFCRNCYGTLVIYRTILRIYHIHIENDICNFSFLRQLLLHPLPLFVRPGEVWRSAAHGRKSRGDFPPGGELCWAAWPLQDGGERHRLSGRSAQGRHHTQVRGDRFRCDKKRVFLNILLKRGLGENECLKKSI